jgi:Uma2 family endonuclease
MVDSKRQTMTSPATLTLPIAEQRVVLHDFHWPAFESFLLALGEHRSARLAYDQGVLEIMSPLRRHESAKRLIGRLIETWVAERGINVASMGSLTLKREDLSRAVEPDECYYIQNEPRIRSKEDIDLAQDPPPDLVLEIDITSPSLLRLPIYEALGVPEVWRYDGRKLHVYILQSGIYVSQNQSQVLPLFPIDLVLELLEEARTLGETAMIQRFSAFIKDQKEIN